MENVLSVIPSNFETVFPFGQEVTQLSLYLKGWGSSPGRSSFFSVDMQLYKNFLEKLSYRNFLLAYVLSAFFHIVDFFHHSVPPS